MHEANTAVVTIVRDDDYFLQRFVEYYGGLFGRENIYVINHGNQESVRRIAEGCNLFPVPDIETKKFTMLHWRTKNGLLSALRQWYRFVLVADVDEFVVVDPATGHNLRTWLDEAKGHTVYTAMGLEIVHLRDKEPEGIEHGILGPRLHAQVNLWYAKPCIIGRPAKLSRGGHYSEHRKLNMPDFLYMFHMKFCDYGLYVDTLDRRNAFVKSKNMEGNPKVKTNPQWFAKNRKDDEIFSAFDARPIDTSFDFSKLRQDLYDSWEPRNHNLWHFKRQEFDELFKLPDRFAGADRVQSGTSDVGAA